MKKLFVLFLTALLLAGCASASAEEAETVSEEISPQVLFSRGSELPVKYIPQPDPLDLILENMTLKQKVGQLFIAAPEQLLPAAGQITAMSSGLASAMEQYPVGGIILFGDNIRSPEQLLALNSALQSAGKLPLFLAVDEEGGAVARLARTGSFGLPRYSSAAAVGASGDPADALEMGRTIGNYLKTYGFNVNFAPVADVNTNPYNPVIGKRAFSSDPVIAAQMAASFAQGLGDEGIAATFKHFPGHGDTAEDSHAGLAVSYKTREALDSCEWLPFLEAGSADMVMIGHIALPNVTGDMTPATLSRQIVTEILKEQLGFSGLVVTDSMQMGAITADYTAGDAAVLALQAGCDLILMPADLEAAFDGVTAAVKDGTLSREWLEVTVRRILEFKVQQGILILEEGQ